jgi:hypothetical protein
MFSYFTESPRLRSVPELTINKQFGCLRRYFMSTPLLDKGSGLGRIRTYDQSVMSRPLCR